MRYIVPFAPGGTTDILARIMGEHFRQAFKQPFLVENKAGAGGNLGAAEVASAAPDGYTILMGTPGTQAINQFLYSKMPYNTEKDFAPVVFVASVPNVLIVHPSLGVKSLKELIERARAKPGSINYATPGPGTTGHLSTELFKSMTKIDLVHVPYKGSGPALQDLLAGQVQMTIDNLPSAMAHIKSGKLIALGVTTAKPVPSLPDVPPIASVAPGYEASSWFVTMAPAATPPAIIARLNAEANNILAKPEVRGAVRAARRRPRRRHAARARQIHRGRDGEVEGDREGIGGKARLIARKPRSGRSRAALSRARLLLPNASRHFHSGVA